MDENDAVQAQAGTAPQPSLPIDIPRMSLASGLYTWSFLSLVPILGPTIPNIATPIPPPAPGPESGLAAEALSSIFQSLWPKEELRLDVDGRSPLMVASGTRIGGLTRRVHWIANLSATGPNSWAGGIWYKDGDVATFPYTLVTITVKRNSFATESATVTFSGGGAANLVRTYQYTSRYFHTAEFEYDWAQGSTPVIDVNTGAHPNHPATLPSETLTIVDVYRRTGFDAKITSGGNAVPIQGAGPDARWSDMELHDAMQTYWSRFANIAQWSIWVFFASLHERGTGLGGIMFDDIGPNQRQGCVILEDSFIANPPAGDAAPAAWVQRMRFWTAVHEMGHCFNLAHSWDKSQGTQWIPLSDEPEARSFMNYPYRVTGGQSAFFANFEYRFSDGELLFLRHAPPRFVEPGNADWFDHHGFQQASLWPEMAFRLQLRANRPTLEFEFLEPVTLELKLTNISDQPQLVPENILSGADNLIVILKKKGKPARQHVPFASVCMKPAMKVLNPGESLYAPLAPYTGLNGMDMIEPGYYMLQVGLHMDQGDLVSNPVNLRVAPPRGYDEEYIAQDFDSYEVARTLGFGGTRFLSKGNDVLAEVVDRLKDRRVAIHANVVLANPLTTNYKLLEIPGDTMEDAKIQAQGVDLPGATKLLSKSVLDQMNVAAESLGHIRFKRQIDFYSSALAEQGEYRDASTTQNKLLKVLTDRKVKDTVLQQIKEARDTYKGEIKQ